MTSNPNNYPNVVGGSTKDYTYQGLSYPAPMPPDYRRIGRCMNLEAILEHWLEKNRFVLVTDREVYKVHEVPVGGEQWQMQLVGEFPIYELAVQFALDAIAKRHESDAEKIARLQGEVQGLTIIIEHMQADAAVEARDAQALVDLAKKRGAE